MGNTALNSGIGKHSKPSKSIYPSASLGAWGEAVAAKEYIRRGFTILGRNIFNRRGKRMGEVDFIARNKTVLAFVEVKTRTVGKNKFGTAVESVNFFKQQKLVHIVQWYLSLHPKLSRLQPRIDACIVEVADLDKTQYSVKILVNVIEG